MATIHFAYQQPYAGPRERNRLRQFLVRLAGSEGYGIDRLAVVFCSDAYLWKINKEYLKHDTYTDIVTFDLRDSPGIISGEIYISIDRVRENARTWEQPIYRELHRVIFHGLLHLCGYKDKLNAEKALMRAKEDAYLESYFAQ